MSDTSEAITKLNELWDGFAGELVQGVQAHTGLDTTQTLLLLLMNSLAEVRRHLDNAARRDEDMAEIIRRDHLDQWDKT